jgi:hypothetical protein
MNPPRAVAFLFVAFVLSSCDTLALGYVNKLQHRITIVEHGRDLARPIVLKPGEIFTPGFGSTAESIDIIGRDGHVFAHYRTRDIPRTESRGSIHYVVIHPNAAVMELKEHPAYNQ